jgi:SNF2 family DNA or RNA helicase
VTHRGIRQPDPVGSGQLQRFSERLERLREYQHEGVAFFVRSDAALLADEMGLGKTIQAAVALDLALRASDCNRALIVAPASVRLNWERELANWAPKLTVRRVRGSAADRAAYYTLPIPVLIASYEQLRIDMPSMAPSVRFDIVILDEAQRIKNRHSETALACHLVRRLRSWGLTGTPVENSPTDLVSIFEFVRPGLLNDAMPRHEMHTRIQPHFLRRRKQEVLPELPPLLMQEIPLELQGPQRAQYDAVWNSRTDILSNRTPVSQATMLTLITRLKQLCNYEPVTEQSVKLDYLRLVIASLTGRRDKLIVFSQYVETLRWISSHLDDVPHSIFHGGLTEGERDAVVEEFETADGPRVLLNSLRAGGVGLNLQAASHVMLYDRWWNPATEDQAVQRAHRFGRDRPLHVIKLLVVDSVEERIAEVLADKVALVKAFADGAIGARAPRLSREELRKMLDLPLRIINE